MKSDAKLTAIRWFERIKSEIGRVVIGQQQMIDLMIHTLLARGHILLEGVPGLAKSLAVETFARAAGGKFKRFQFTPDKMPGDITGASIYNEREKKFDYCFGPVFCNIFLADEINRASPKVQSALLEAMQERKVDVERETHSLPDPFMVLATQNPIEQVGTYPLAEAQVDRFMVKFNVDYPSRDRENELMARKNADFEERKANVRAVTSMDEILALQKRIHVETRVGPRIINYILDICARTRPPAGRAPDAGRNGIHEYIRLGASPRGAEYLLALSKARAFGRGRDFVNFEDVNACAFHVLRHRILTNNRAVAERVSADDIIMEILKSATPY